MIVGNKKQISELVGKFSEIIELLLIDEGATDERISGIASILEDANQLNALTIKDFASATQLEKIVGYLPPSLRNVMVIIDGSDDSLKQVELLSKHLNKSCVLRIKPTLEFRLTPDYIQKLQALKSEVPITILDRYHSFDSESVQSYRGDKIYICSDSDIFKNDIIKIVQADLKQRPAKTKSFASTATVVATATSLHSQDIADAPTLPAHPVQPAIQETPTARPPEHPINSSNSVEPPQQPPKERKKRRRRRHIHYTPQPTSVPEESTQPTIVTMLYEPPPPLHMLATPALQMGISAYTYQPPHPLYPQLIPHQAFPAPLPFAQMMSPYPSFGEIVAPSYPPSGQNVPYFSQQPPMTGYYPPSYCPPPFAPVMYQSPMDAAPPSAAYAHGPTQSTGTAYYPHGYHHSTPVMYQSPMEAAVIPSPPPLHASTQNAGAIVHSTDVLEEETDQIENLSRKYRNIEKNRSTSTPYYNINTQISVPLINQAYLYPNGKDIVIPIRGTISLYNVKDINSLTKITEDIMIRPRIFGTDVKNAWRCQDHPDINQNTMILYKSLSNTYLIPYQLFLNTIRTKVSKDDLTKLQISPKDSWDVKHEKREAAGSFVQRELGEDKRGKEGPQF